LHLQGRRRAPYRFFLNFRGTAPCPPPSPTPIAPLPWLRTTEDGCSVINYHCNCILSDTGFCNFCGKQFLVCEVKLEATEPRNLIVTRKTSVGSPSTGPMCLSSQTFSDSDIQTGAPPGIPVFISREVKEWFPHKFHNLKRGHCDTASH